MQASKTKIYEFVIALVAILLVVWLLYPKTYLILISLALGFIALILPVALAIPAKGYFSFLKILGTINSKILLTAVFFIVLVPVAYLKKIFSRSDALMLKNDGKETFWHKTDKKFGQEDIINLY